MYTDENGFEYGADLAPLRKDSDGNPLNKSSVVITRTKWNDKGTIAVAEQRARITVSTAKREEALKDIQANLGNYMFDEDLGGGWFTAVHVGEDEVVEKAKA